MEHVVFFPAPDGSPAFRRVPSLEEAVRLVEHLRNDYAVDAVTVHALTEVPLSFRAYYKVEVPATSEVAQVPAPEPVAEPIAELPPEPAPEPSVDVAAEQVPAQAVVLPQVADDAAVLASAPVPTPAKVPLGRTGSLGFFAR